MPYGLTEKIIQKVNRVFTNYENIDEVILYGSRAKGNYSEGSGIDLDDLLLRHSNTEIRNQFLQNIDTPLTTST